MNLLLSALLALSMLVPSGLSAAALTSDFFVGDWQCRSKNRDLTFTWLVRDDKLSGGWLIGEAWDNDVRLALEIWAHDAGALSTRRQFGADGGFISLNVVEREVDALRSEGTIATKDREQIPVRHTVRKDDQSTLSVLWEIDFGGGFETLNDETCTRLDPTNSRIEK